VKDRLLADPGPLPGGGESEIAVISNGFPIGRLIFFAKMGTARFFSA
jgi:hypothetical protein